MNDLMGDQAFDRSIEQDDLYTREDLLKSSSDGGSGSGSSSSSSDSEESKSSHDAEDMRFTKNSAE